MTEKEYILLCISEECAEISHRISKALRFTTDETEPGQDKSNIDRIEEEIIDLLALIDIAGDHGILNLPSMLDIPYDLTIGKRAKLKKYMDYSRSLGVVTGWKG